jgi:thiol:disulfide interchange protein
MEGTTLESEKVKKELENFVWVKLNYGDKDAKKYGIKPKHVPTVYFMRNNLKELAVAKGFFKQDDFLKWVKYAKSKIKKTN